MSYFMTISGALPQQAFPQLEFLPISKGQKYVADLEPEISATDGIPLWFVHDRETGTSHNFVCDAENHYNRHDTLAGTLLLRLMQACVEAGCAFRIWTASNDPTCHRHVAEFTSFDELSSGIAKMLSEGRGIGVRRKRNGQQGAAPKGGPAPPLGNSGVTEGPPSVS